MGQCQECNKALTATEEIVCDKCKAKILAEIEQDWQTTNPKSTETPLDASPSGLWENENIDQRTTGVSP